VDQDDAALDARLAALGSRPPTYLATPKLTWRDGTPLSPAALGWIVDQLRQLEGRSAPAELDQVLARLERRGKAQLCDALCAPLSDPLQRLEPHLWLGGEAQLEQLCLDLDRHTLPRGRPDWGWTIAQRPDPVVIQWLNAWRLRDEVSQRAIFGSALAEIARARGVTVEELVEASLPDLGFDPEGVARLAVGPASVTLRFTPEGELELLDDDGGRLDAIPRSLGAPHERAAARARLELLRRTLDAWRTGWSKHLERAMLAERAWEPSAAVALFRHPLLRPLVTCLLWRAGEMCFAVDGAGEPVGEAGEPIELTSTVTLPHPVLLSASERSRWIGRLRGQPFAQLARALAPVDPEAPFAKVLAQARPLDPRMFFRALTEGGASHPPEGVSPDGRVTRSQIRVAPETFLVLIHDGCHPSRRGAPVRITGAEMTGDVTLSIQSEAVIALRRLLDL
jgi:hypothetical protein